MSNHCFLGRHKEGTAATKQRDRWGCLFIFFKTANACMHIMHMCVYVDVLRLVRMH